MRSIISTRPLFLPLLLLLPGLLAGCDSPSPAALPVVPMQIGTRVFQLEVAATPATMETGLMNRDSMPADHGMLFVFPDEAMRGFWMKNTRIPLDIIFIDLFGKVVSIHQMKPLDEQITSSDFPAEYAVELNAGAATSAGVKEGDHLKIPPIRVK